MDIADRRKHAQGDRGVDAWDREEVSDGRIGSAEPCELAVSCLEFALERLEESQRAFDRRPFVGGQEE